METLKVVNDFEIYRALEHLPKDLNETYHRFLESIGSNFTTRARLLLQWLAVASRPLYIEELMEAYAFHTGPAPLIAPNIPEMLRGLIVIDPVLNYEQPSNGFDNCTYTVSLAHVSLTEYLLDPSRQGAVSHPFCFEIEEAHGIVAKNCLQYIHHYNNDDYDGTRCLLNYAWYYWESHIITDGEMEDDIIAGAETDDDADDDADDEANAAADHKTDNDADNETRRRRAHVRQQYRRKARNLITELEQIWDRAAGEERNSDNSSEPEFEEMLERAAGEECNFGHSPDPALLRVISSFGLKDLRMLVVCLEVPWFHQMRREDSRDLERRTPQTKRDFGPFDVDPPTVDVLQVMPLLTDLHGLYCRMVRKPIHQLPPITIIVYAQRQNSPETETSLNGHMTRINYILERALRGTAGVMRGDEVAICVDAVCLDNQTHAVGDRQTRLLAQLYRHSGFTRVYPRDPTVDIHLDTSFRVLQEHVDGITASLLSSSL